ncbi:unnamed protein product [Microthlaspi erraticum]|uniref:Uncharacterized protein n=1 Tax=Microthlaspi erraticum TaxID=1685480 RepID=A0A6D2HPV1_9BRAS|nr:unnamed protein product [Microthlaspi erraticum]
MQSLRSVITQATRGGRWVSSRRNFSSSPVPKETNGTVRVGDAEEPWGALKREIESFGVKDALVSSGYACLGVALYSALAFGRREIAYQELYKAKKLAMLKNEN